MRGIILSAFLISLSVFGFSQEKSAPASNEVETTQENVKIVRDKSALKVASPAPNAVEKKRSAAPAKKVQRSAEMIEKKKTAPLLSEPQ